MICLAPTSIENRAVSPLDPLHRQFRRRGFKLKTQLFADRCEDVPTPRDVVNTLRRPLRAHTKGPDGACIVFLVFARSLDVVDDEDIERCAVWSQTQAKLFLHRRKQPGLLIVRSVGPTGCQRR